MRVGEYNFYAKTDSFDLSLFVDGLFVARQVVYAPYGTSEDAYFFLPEIPAGEHEFRLVWHNWEVNTFLAVYDLRFVNFGGPDANGDGVADWKEHRADEATGEWVADTTKPVWTESYTIDKAALGDSRIRLTWTWGKRIGHIISIH